MMKIEIGQLIRSRRRSISAEINHNAELIIRAPKWVSQKFINDFVEQRKAWILKHRELALQKKQAEYQFIEGEKFLYLGHEYPLQLDRYAAKRLALIDGVFYLAELYANQARKEFLYWYKEQARLQLESRAAHFAGLMGLHYKALRINQAKRQWGSCTADNRISFTWRLVMAPLFVIDSVVVHELSHIREKNHSAKFWREVKSFYPRYDEANAWLAQHSHRLHL